MSPLKPPGKVPRVWQSASLSQATSKAQTPSRVSIHEHTQRSYTISIQSLMLNVTLNLTEQKVNNIIP